MLPPEELPEATYCSLLSQQAGEDLFATASQAQVYLLLEYNGPWERKAVEASSIPVGVKTHLAGALKRLPLSKLLLIKSQSGLVERGIRFFVTNTGPVRPFLWGFHIERYEELLDLDIPDLLQQPERYGALRVPGPLFLTCTNGRRDLCCAKFGMPVYVEMLKEVGEAAWQCTHVGGHRFAANVIVLPHGLLYGRVQPGDVTALVESYRAGRVLLEKLRGQTAYPPPAQAASYFLRQASGRLDLGAFQLQELEELQPERWRVSFLAQEPDLLYGVEVRREVTGIPLVESCSGEKVTALAHFRLEGINSLQG